jgi:hypothetical protein
VSIFKPLQLFLPISQRRTKVGVPQLEIFLLKFYLLNEKEKLKLYIQNPPVKFTKVSSKSRGF